jgi:hypothetical protein
MSPVEFSPQSAKVIDVEQSEAARTKDTGIKPVASTTSTKATTLHDHVADLLAFMKIPTDQTVRLGRKRIALGSRQAFADFSTL